MLSTSQASIKDSYAAKEAARAGLTRERITNTADRQRRCRVRNRAAGASAGDTLAYPPSRVDGVYDEADSRVSRNRSCDIRMRIAVSEDVLR